jgi:hypothetical protein
MCRTVDLPDRELRRLLLIVAIINRHMGIHIRQDEQG